MREDFYYDSCDGKTKIHGVKWGPDGKVRGVIQIAHGVTEYILRYDRFAKYMTERGFVVIGNDHLGHGESVLNKDNVMYFGADGSYEDAVGDLYTCYLKGSGEYDNVPYCLIGFSLGSFLVRDLLIKHPGLVDGAIIMGTGDISSIELKLARMAVWNEGRHVDDNKTSPGIRKLTFGTYNKKFKPNRTDYDWLCADNKQLDEYIADLHRGEDFTVGLFREMLNSMQVACFKKNIEKMSKEMPILLLSGGDDPVGNFGKGVIKTYNKFKQAKIASVDMKIYPGMRHDILHEAKYLEVYNDIVDFINAKIVK